MKSLKNHYVRKLESTAGELEKEVEELREDVALLKGNRIDTFEYEVRTSLSTSLSSTLSGFSHPSGFYTVTDKGPLSKLIRRAIADVRKIGTAYTVRDVNIILHERGYEVPRCYWEEFLDSE